MGEKNGQVKKEHMEAPSERGGRILDGQEIEGRNFRGETQGDQKGEAQAIIRRRNEGESSRNHRDPEYKGKVGGGGGLAEKKK